MAWQNVGNATLQKRVVDGKTEWRFYTKSGYYSVADDVVVAATNRFKSVIFVDSLLGDNEWYEATTLEDGRWVLKDSADKILLMFGAASEVIVPVNISFTNSELSGADSNLQIKVFRGGEIVHFRDMYWTEGPLQLVARVGDTVQAEARSIINLSAGGDRSDPWPPGTTQYLEFTGLATKTTTDNPGSLVSSKVLTDQTPIVISAYTQTV